jgi:hypothetical protein
MTLRRVAKCVLLPFVIVLGNLNLQPMRISSVEESTLRYYIILPLLNGYI